jgi:chitodextrinase
MRFFAVSFGILIYLGVFGSPLLALAQDATQEFYVRVLAGEDTEPPTTPTLLTIDPISSTQIDITWSVAVDNFTLSGYVVERRIGSSSTSTIATTTLTSFSDTGLTPSTTYTYAVRAFDSFSNYSSSSNSLSTTTPNPPPPTPVATSTPAGESTQARVVAEEIVVTPSISTTTFLIRSPRPARYDIRWGRTADYELGFISSDILRREYRTILTELEPATTYQYEIIGYTPAGFASVVEQGQFRTLAAVDSVAPPNVNRFTAVPAGFDVNLFWQLPPDNDLAFVRIVRSHLGYPSNPTDGAVIYQGLGTTATDVGVFERYSPVYYTAFVYDESGNVSSGAITLAFYDDGSGPPVTGEAGTGDGAGTDGVPTAEDTFVLEPLATTSQAMPDNFDIVVKQGQTEYSFADAKISLAFDRSFIIRLPVESVTTNLKSIIVQLQDPTDQRKTFAFLLRLNKDTTAYEAVVAPLQVVGTSRVVLSVYDFRALRVAEYRTTLVFEEVVTQPTTAEIEAGDRQLLWLFLLSVAGLLGLLIWWLLYIDRDEDEEDEADKPKVTVT